MISKEIQKLLNKQINAELWSAYLYLSMSIDAESNGYHGVSHWCYIQAQEELDHSRILQKYMLSQESRITLTPIEKVAECWSSPLEMFRDILSHEKVITKMINEIMLKAQQEHDYATTSMLMWFVDEQVEEEESCLDLVQQFTKASDSPCCFMQIDYELQKRTYTPYTKKESNWKC